MHQQEKDDSREEAAAKMRSVFQQEQWFRSPLDGPAVADVVAQMGSTPETVLAHYREIVFPEMKVR